MAGGSFAFSLKSLLYRLEGLFLTSFVACWFQSSGFVLMRFGRGSSLSCFSTSKPRKEEHGEMGCMYTAHIHGYIRNTRLWGFYWLASSYLPSFPSSSLSLSLHRGLRPSSFSCFVSCWWFRLRSFLSSFVASSSFSLPVFFCSSSLVKKLASSCF